MRVEKMIVLVQVQVEHCFQVEQNGQLQCRQKGLALKVCNHARGEGSFFHCIPLFCYLALAALPDLVPF